MRFLASPEGVAERSESFKIMIAGGNHTEIKKLAWQIIGTSEPIIYHDWWGAATAKSFGFLCWMVQSGTYTSHRAAFLDQPFAAPHQSAGSEVPSQIPALQITINLSVNRLLQTSLRRESNTAVKVKDSPWFTIAVIIKICIHTPISFKGFNINYSGFPDSLPFQAFVFRRIRVFFKTFRHNRHHFSLFTCIKEWKSKGAVSQTIGQESFLEYPISDCGSLLEKNLSR